jgi:hypothetical protein
VAGKVILFGVVAVFVAWLAVPQLRDGSFKLIRPSEPVTVVLRGESQSSLKPGIEPDDADSPFQLVTLLGFDAIPAILEPEFVSAPEADAWMAPDEQVLALSINGESRAYSVPLLSRHEIVNDVVGGVPVAVTW